MRTPGVIGMGSKRLTYVVLAALLMAAVAIVAVSVARHRAATARPTGAIAQAADQVVCPVCGSVHPRGEMHEVTLDIVGYAPDSSPVLLCSERCAALAKQNPERYSPVLPSTRPQTAEKRTPDAEE